MASNILDSLRELLINKLSDSLTEKRLIVGVGLLWSLWAWLWGLPLPISGFLFFGAAVLTWACINQYRRHKAHTAMYPEFYQNQAEMVQATGGGIVKDLQEASRLWISMIAGNQISLRDTEVLKKIDKLMFVNPDSALMDILARVQPGREKTFRSSIAAALEKFPKNNGKVGLSDTPVLNVVIGNPDEPDAWARIQLFLPYVSGEPSVSIKITKKGQPKAFATVRQSFLDTWEGSLKLQ